MDACSRLVIGWSIAPHMRTELVTDALGMAILRRRPEADATVLHSDHGCRYTSWAFGQRLRNAGLLASMGTVGGCYDNAMMESFRGTMQLELLDNGIRAACCAREIRVTRDRRWAALVVVDVIRRDPLSAAAVVGSPLAGGHG